MPAHRLILEDVWEQPFKLLAIHSSVEDFRLAFLLNKHLGLHLGRSKKDIDFQYGHYKARYPLYHYENPSGYCAYHLVGNVSRAEVSGDVADSLFGEEISFRKVFLLPEYKQVDFLLKVQDDSGMLPEQAMLGKLKEIPQVSTAYWIDINEVKSKENLIFD